MAKSAQDLLLESLALRETLAREGKILEVKQPEIKPAVKEVKPVDAEALATKGMSARQLLEYTLERQVNMKKGTPSVSEELREKVKTNPKLYLVGKLMKR